MSKWIKTVFVSGFLYLTSDRWDSSVLFGKDKDGSDKKNSDNSLTSSSIETNPALSRAVLASVFSDTSEKSKSESFYYFQCLISDALENSHDEYQLEQEGRSCCQSIQHAAYHLISSSDQLKQLSHACVSTNLASLAHYDTNNDHASATIPLFTFQWSPFPPTTTQSMLLPPKPPLQQTSTWQHFMWDDASSKGMWLTSDSDRNVENLHKEKISSDFLPLFTKSDSTKLETFAANLTSTMADYGGMHRQLTHELVIDDVSALYSSSNDCASDDNCEAATLEYQFDILLPVSSDVFINPEDAVSHIQVTNTDTKKTIHDANTTITILTDTKNPINQEEPAFVSPQYAPILRIKANLTASNDTMSSITLSWKTEMHLRYPMPVASMPSAYLLTQQQPKLIRGNYQQIHIVAPTLVHGSVEKKSANTPGIVYDLATASPLPLQKTMTAWVASGPAIDLWYILGTTILVSLVGAGLMLVDVMRIKHWHRSY